MQEQGSQGNFMWVEEDLCKLSCKELKKLARQSSVNPNFRKADLVKALLSINNVPLIPNTTEKKENNSGKRITRSRASISQPLNTGNIVEDSEFTVNIQANKILDQANELKGQNKNKRKRKTKIESSAQHDASLNISGVFKLVSSVEVNEQPLEEITNKNTRKSKKTKLSSEPRISQDELNSKNESKFNSHCNHSKNEKLDGSPSFNEKSEQKTRKRGRKKKVPEHNIISLKEMESSTKETVDVETIEVKCMVNEDGIKKRIDDQESQLDGSMDKKCDPNKENMSKKQKNNGVMESEGSTLKDINISDVLSPEVLPLNVESSSASSDDSVGKKRSTSRRRGSINSSNTKNCVTSDSPIRDCQPPSFPIANNMAEASDIPGPVRGATFVLDDKEPTQIQTRHSSTTKPLDMDAATSIKLSATFTLNDKVSKISGQSNSLDKSIGKKILSSAVKHGHMKSNTKPGTASAVKKTIMKNTTTPGSAYRNKYGTAKKAPNFKNIHQKLFGSMESARDNRERIIQRAQELMQSPIVPKCAFAIKSSPAEKLKEGESTSKKRISPRLTNVLPSTSRIVMKKPTPNHPPHIGGLRSSSVNRFGFKRINKVEAKELVGNKMPHIELDKKKEHKRTILQGVRMNKRFMLQMQMRQSKN